MKRLVYFGSAFNPPHAGHIHCMQWLMTRTNVDLVFAGPNKEHAFHKRMANFEARCSLIQNLLNYFNMPSNVQVCRIENEMTQGGSPVYTYDVLVALKKLHPKHSIVFGLGPDNVEQFSRFYRYQDILNDFELEKCPAMGSIRSTDIRLAAQKENTAFIAKHTSPLLVTQILECYK